jgi:signal transduction histidine kinase
VTEERTTDERRDFADRTVVGWHVLFYALVVVAGVVLTAQGHGVVALPVLMLLALAYALIGVPAYYRGDRRGVLIYVAISYLALGALCSLDESALILLFALYPQAFLLLERRWAIGAATALTAVFTVVALLSDGWDSAELSWRLLLAAGNLAFALVIGLFIDGIIRESTRRKELVEELRAAQASLAAAERDAGAAAERERLARDIHDTLAQGFTSIVMLSQAGETAAARGDTAAAAARLAEIQTTARDNLGEARALVASMAPPALGDGLLEAVRRLATRHTDRTGVPVLVSVTGTVRPLSPASEVAALRATQESLANAERHSRAASISVGVEYDDAGATVIVADDGAGFDPAAPRSGFGLDGLAARAESVGGWAEVDSEPGRGTRVRVRVP